MMIVKCMKSSFTAQLMSDENESTRERFQTLNELHTAEASDFNLGEAELLESGKSWIFKQETSHLQ